MAKTISGQAAHDRDQLRALVEAHKHVVFFGGAGVSTASGIPDFRSATGVFSQQYPYPPEKMCSHSFFMEHTQGFFDFYRSKMVFTEAEPNAAHVKLAELEREGILDAVVTQNIDGLHQAAGSKNVFELHGSIHRNYCMKCDKPYGLDTIVGTDDVPRCECGGIIKPDVVLYEEPLNGEVINGAIGAITNADMLIVAGTSLVVYPAASFLDYFRGDCLAVVNMSSTKRDGQANFLSRESIADVLDW